MHVETEEVQLVTEANRKLRVETAADLGRGRQLWRSGLEVMEVQTGGSRGTFQLAGRNMGLELCSVFSMGNQGALW